MEPSFLLCCLASLWPLLVNIPSLCVPIFARGLALFVWATHLAPDRARRPFWDRHLATSHVLIACPALTLNITTNSAPFLPLSLHQITNSVGNQSTGVVLYADPSRGEVSERL